VGLGGSGCRGLCLPFVWGPAGVCARPKFLFDQSGMDVVSLSIRQGRFWIGPIVQAVAEVAHLVDCGIGGLEREGDVLVGCNEGQRCVGNWVSQAE